MATNPASHPETPVMTAQGLSHDLDLYPDRLVIHNIDILSRLFSHDDVVLYNTIEGVHIYQPSSAVSVGPQLIIVLKDGKSRALSFHTDQQHTLQTIKDTIESFVNHREIITPPKSL